VVRASRGVRAHRVKRRRMPARGGEGHLAREQRDRQRLLVIPREGAKVSSATGGGSTRTMEDVLVHGRAALDEATREEDPGDSERRGSSSNARSAESHGERTSETESQARPGVNSTPAGRRSAEGSTIVTPPGPRGAVHVGQNGESHEPDARSAAAVEAGGSPSSEALPGGTFGKWVEVPNLRSRGFGPG